MGRDRGKGKRGGRGSSGRRFAAQSAEEIEQRNQRLAAFDAARAKRRAEADDEEGGDADAEREAMLAGMRGASLNDDGDDGGEYVEKEYKAKGLEGIIETENLNKAPARNMKISDLGGDEAAAPMTRREREEKEKEAKAAAYRKRHEAGLTEEYKRDMAKLAEVKKRREAAEAKKKAEEEADKLAEEERKKAAEASGATGGDGDSDSDDDDDKKKKKKKKSKKKSNDDIPKLDKITIKKMKPAMLKEHLKERGLEIQGNAKQLTDRLLEYEKNR